MSLSLSRRRLLISVLFLLPGFAMSSWITRIPAVRDRIGASTAEMGLVLLGLSAGSLAGTMLSGRLVARWGASAVIVVGQAINASSVILVGLTALIGNPVLVTASLVLVGLGMGVQNVALNVEGSEVERLSLRSVLPSLHGFFSSGMVLGALVGWGMTAARVPVPVHLPVVGAIALAAPLLLAQHLPAGVGQRPRLVIEPDLAPLRVAVWRDPRLVLIGALIFALCLSEGTANDWLPLIMVDGHGLSATASSGTFAIFATAMATGRMVGGLLVDRLGRAVTLAGGAALAGVGLTIVIFVDNAVAAGLAALLWGLGASLGYPLAVSAAADSGPHPEARVAFTASIGGIAQLAGPPVLGLLGEAWGLRRALVVVLGLVVVAFCLTPATRHRRPVAVASSARTTTTSQTSG